MEAGFAGGFRAYGLGWTPRRPRSHGDGTASVSSGVSTAGEARLPWQFPPVRWGLGGGRRRGRGGRPRPAPARIGLRPGPRQGGCQSGWGASTARTRRGSRRRRRVELGRPVSRSIERRDTGPPSQEPPKDRPHHHEDHHQDEPGLGALPGIPAMKCCRPAAIRAELQPRHVGLAGRAGGGGHGEEGSTGDRCGGGRRQVSGFRPPFSTPSLRAGTSCCPWCCRC